MEIKGNYYIPAPHGRLEAIYRPGTENATRVAMVLHPHPLHGGTMHNKVVHRTAKALQECGFETLRFNFRGVGHSTGTFDEGAGESEDAQIALEFLLENHPHARQVIVAGFSFGSVIGLRLGCADPRVDRLIAIGVPARLGSLNFLFECTKSKLFLHGEEDDIAPLAPLREFLDRLPAVNNNRLVTIPGGNHFFDHHGRELMREVKEFVLHDPLRFF